MSTDKNALNQEELTTTDSMAGHVLEKEEVDDLLQGANSDGKGLRALVQTSTVSLERLPMLEVIFDRLMILLSTSLRAFTSDNVDLKVEEIKSSRFKDYLDNVKLPAMFNVILLKEWDTMALLVVDNAMIYTVVDVLLGGRREEVHDVQGRSYTTIERALNEEFIRVILKDLSQAFEPVEKVEFTFARAETNPRFAMIDRPNNAGVIVRVNLKMDDREGKFEFFFPHSSIEPVREKLLQTYIGEKFGNDKIWENHLAREVWGTTIEAEALLDQVTVKLSDVLKWKKGSSLPLETFEGANIVVKCGERSLFSGKIGNVRKRVAVQIEENFLTKEKQS